MDYKNTLLMPKTEFEMRGKLPTKEPEIQKFWDEIDLYELLLTERANQKSFVLHDGPPYANGDIHIGHGLNKIIKDIVNRSKSIQGYLTPYIPGWDTHGLPIETAITKTGIDRKAMSVADFRQLCEDYAYQQIDIQMAGFKRLGSLGDYKHPYITMTKDYEAAQIRIFGKMALDGLIYQGFKPVYWSPSSETALAEGELEYHDKVDTSVYVNFKVVDGKGIIDDDCSIMCWTTMPWTLVSTVGISLGDNIKYGLYETSKGKLFFARDLELDISTKLDLPLNLIKEFNGQDLVGVLATNPLNDRVCPVVLGDHVTTSDGTGCVTTAPAHGTEDFLVAQKYEGEFDLPIILSCDKQGHMASEAGPRVEGMYWEKANKEIIKIMEEKGTLIFKLDMTHSYPYDWRTKKPIIFMAALQWFCSIDKKRAELLHEINNVKWTPAWGKLRMHNMISDRGDWCISRQRAWGVPIPIIYNQNDVPIIDGDIFEFVASKIAEYGSNYWFDSNIEDLLPQSFKDSHPDYLEYHKERDIMDVWFDSGSSHTGCILARGMEYPVDMYLEGSDQYRGWFNSSLIVGTCYHGQSPYREVLSHGFTLDGHGNKMSKSLGNTMEPKKIINQYGADVFRYWVASTDYQSDQRISDEVLKQVSDTYRKVRNTYRFLLGNLNHFDDTKLLAINDLTDVDKYILIKLNKLHQNCINYYNAYEYSNVYNSINNFIVKELSAFYMDFTKDILYILKEDDLRRLQVQTVLYYCLERINMLLVPFLPHTSEEVYTYLPKSNKKVSVHLEVLPELLEIANASDIEVMYDRFMLCRDDVLKALEIARDQKIVGKSLEAKLTICFKEEYQFMKDIDNLKQLFIVSKVIITDEIKGQDYPSANIAVERFDGHMCPRCWNIFDEEEMVDGLCQRCDEVINH
ncbi:MAG: isoleucine--tRNA ligase [Bacilli bacterium]|jgi:isoleucyl-tRNA synthetase|nr:isoleucine--tRNA ligase [Bacilli bacterium]